MLVLTAFCSMRFPEPFLWHIFYHLIQGCKTFEEGPWRSLSRNSFGDELDDGYLLHGDIKPDNGNLALSQYRTFAELTQ
jgi:hypothetical protein